MSNLHLPDATNSTQHERHAAAVRAVATITVATCSFCHPHLCHLEQVCCALKFCSLKNE